MSIDQQTFFEQQMMREENCVSMYTRFAGIVSDQGLRNMFHEFARQAQEHRDTIRSILSGQGIVEDGVMQNRATQEESPVSGPLDQRQDQLTHQSGTPPARGKDEDMIADSLLAMKSLSEGYRSALRLVSEERVAAALIGMRQDEDKQKEQLARYMGGPR
jgi:hypothetical protein